MEVLVARSLSEERKASGSFFLTLDTILLLYLGSSVERLLVTIVPDGDIGTSLGEGLGNCETNTRSSTRNDGSSTFK